MELRNDRARARCGRHHARGRAADAYLGFRREDQRGRDQRHDPNHETDQQRAKSAPTAAAILAASFAAGDPGDEFRILIERALALHQAARDIRGYRVDDVRDFVRLREHAAANAGVVQEAVGPLVAPHGDMGYRIDPQPRRVATAHATVEQLDLGRQFGEQRIERLVQKLKPRDFGIAQIDHDAGALGRLDARLMHRLRQRGGRRGRGCRRIGFALSTPHQKAVRSLERIIHQRLGSPEAAARPGQMPKREIMTDSPGNGTTNGPLLVADAVTLQYKTTNHLVTATGRVSFEVHQGDRYVLLGPSGCGKSSLLKSIGGFLPPVSGSFHLNGRPIERPGSDRMMVFQEFDQLLPWKTVLGNVMFPLLVNRRMSRAGAREQARKVIAKVNLGAFEDTYPHMLSGGMKQRVAIARALAMEPAVLLMDEPFAALDALTRRKMQEELVALWDDVGFTVIFVTHSIDEALLIGNRILVLSPHPGQVNAELNAGHLGFADLGTQPFELLSRRIHELLFSDRIETALTNEAHHG